MNTLTNIIYVNYFLLITDMYFSRHRKYFCIKMNFDKSWDVEKYKLSHENEEHWNLKKKFLIAHKDKFSEEKLICLAQVFINVKFLGCK